MKIEVGKHYRTIEGHKVFVRFWDEEIKYRFIAQIFDIKEQKWLSQFYLFFKDGKCDGISDLDLIEECDDEISDKEALDDLLDYHLNMIVSHADKIREITLNEKV